MVMRGDGDCCGDSDCSDHDVVVVMVWKEYETHTFTVRLLSDHLMAPVYLPYFH